MKAENMLRTGKTGRDRFVMPIVIVTIAVKLWASSYRLAQQQRKKEFIQYQRFKSHFWMTPQEMLDIFERLAKDYKAGSIDWGYKCQKAAIAVWNHSVRQILHQRRHGRPEWEKEVKFNSEVKIIAGTGSEERQGYWTEEDETADGRMEDGEAEGFFYSALDRFFSNNNMESRARVKGQGQAGLSLQYFEQEDNWSQATTMRQDGKVTARFKKIGKKWHRRVQDQRVRQVIRRWQATARYWRLHIRLIAIQEEGLHPPEPEEADVTDPGLDVFFPASRSRWSRRHRASLPPSPAARVRRGHAAETRRRKRRSRSRPREVTDQYKKRKKKRSAERGGAERYRPRRRPRAREKGGEMENAVVNTFD